MGINTGYIQGYADDITGIINDILIPVLMAIALLVFLWGIYRYFIKGASNESEKGEGRTFALYGVIGFVIMVSLWGIVQIFMTTLNLDTSNNAPPPPTFGTSGQTSSQTTNSLFPTGGTTELGGSTGGGTQANGCAAGLVLDDYGGCTTPSNTTGGASVGSTGVWGCTTSGALYKASDYLDASNPNGKAYGLCLQFCENNPYVNNGKCYQVSP